LQDQADKAQQLHGILPDGVHRAADARQQLDAGAFLRLFDGHAEIIQGAVDGLEQRAVGGGETAVGLFGGVLDALGPQQLHEQRGAGSV
jgi:hypothetical protein